MPKLFDDDSDNDLNIKTDTDYAKNYNSWRKKEELHKLQAKYGEISSSSDSSSEDDDEEPDGNFDKDFFKTLSFLKTKDNRIYDKNFEFFDNVEESEATKSNIKKIKQQPMYIKDYERKLILEKGGKLSDDEDEGGEKHELSKPFTYKDEQNELKENLKNALDDVEEENSDGENWGGLFKTREKTHQEEQKEEQDYIQWLAGQTENLEDESTKKELKPLKQFWSDPKLDEGEKFLRDYILKKRFLEDENADYVPTYDEIIHDSDENFSEDERAIDKQEEFEHKYNFRFEEPDQEFIKRYPRTLENSLRQKDDKRKVKRLERKERKIEEKKQKMEEINKLKQLKKQEIEEKIKKLKEITGNAEVAFDVKDFEDDFDPDEHDRRMQSLFNKEFYEGPEGEQKPEFPDIDEELELENWDHWHGDDNEGDNGVEINNEASTQPHCEDEDFNMDCDYDPAATQQELINNSKRKKRRKRKSKFAQVLSEPKPMFDPNDRTYQAYLDEYYKLDCEDIIGDIPCRFKYRRVIPNDFGLSIEEILSAKDKELNRWCSLKRALQYRPDHVEKYDVIAFSKKGQNLDLKKKYLPSLFASENEETNALPAASTNDITADTSNKKRKNRKKSSSNSNVDISTTEDDDVLLQSSKDVPPPEESVEKQESNNNTTKKVKNKKRKSVNEDIVESQNINITTKITLPKSKKRKHKEANLNHEATNDSKPKKQKQELFKTKRKKVKQPKQEIGMTDARLAAYGFKPKKYKNKLKYGNV